jgi:hypothetical protein
LTASSQTIAAAGRMPIAAAGRMRKENILFSWPDLIATCHGEDKEPRPKAGPKSWERTVARVTAPR